MSTPAASASGRRFLAPLFVSAALLLLFAAAGLRPAIAAATRHYSKQPIALNRSLDDFDGSRLASFRPVAGTAGISLAKGDVETEDVISPAFDPIAGTGSTAEQVMLFVTYYSDPRTQIPHTPEVCYRQSGAVVQAMRTVVVDTPGLGPDRPQVEARLLDIDNYGHRTVLAYVLVCNGGFYYDREPVRFAIGWPGDKHTYFSKVEAVTHCKTKNDYEAAVERVTSLLREALPILVADHYPTAEQLRP